MRRLVKRTLVDKIIADLLRYPEWRSAVCSDPETAIGAPQWRKLTADEKTVIQNIACGTKAGAAMTVDDIEAELNAINRTMGHYVTD